MTPDQIEKIEPFNLEAAFVGSFLISDVDFNNSRAIVVPEMIKNLKIRKVYEAMSQMADAGEPFDPVTIKNRIQASMTPKAATVLITLLMEATHTSVHALKYAHEIRKRFWRVVANQFTDAGEIDNAIASLDRARDSMKRSDLEPKIQSAIDNAERRAQRKRPDFYTGIRALDDVLILDRQMVFTLGAYTSQGKTSFALNLSLALLAGGRRGVLYSYEASEESLIYRMLSILSGVGNIRNGRWNGNAGKVHDSIERLRSLVSEGRFAIECGMTLDRIIADTMQYKPDFAIVDYIQNLGNLEKTMQQETRAALIARIMSRLEGLAVKQNMLMIVVSQINREGSRANRKPLLSDLRDSGGIEQSSHSVLLGYWKYATDGLANANEWNAIIAKQKDGPVCEKIIGFDPASYRFYDP